MNSKTERAVKRGRAWALTQSTSTAIPLPNWRQRRERHPTALRPAGQQLLQVTRSSAGYDDTEAGARIEAVLAVATGIEHRATLLRPAWACGSAGTLEAFPVLPGVEALTILADHDAGRAAEHCTQRWADSGREVTILTPRDLGDMNIVRRAAT
jgi:hypothetical protein